MIKSSLVFVMIFVGASLLFSCSSEKPSVTEIQIEEFEEFFEEKSLEELFLSVEEQPAKIEKRGDILLFDGEINGESYAKLLDIVQKEGTPKLIYIRSLGGFTDFGLQMGDYIYDNNVDVRVKDICFSSCGNYIFLAGNKKTIENGALVGWHGSLIQDDILALSEDTTGEERFRKTVREALEEMTDGESLEKMTDGGSLEEITAGGSLEEIIEEEVIRWRRDKEIEGEFFRKINVDQDIVVLGHLPRHYESFFKPNNSEDGFGEYGGWTATLTTMEKFGVSNIEYLGDGDYPEVESYFVLKLKVLE